MSDVMSFAEVHDQLVELLPARTVLSLLHAAQSGVIGVPGESGTRGASGAGLVDYMWTGILGSNDQSSSPRLIAPVGTTSQPGSGS